MTDEIVHDAEYYILRQQHRERWDLEDENLDTRLAELREEHGGPPNIIHIMWDDMAFGDAGIPVCLSPVFRTPDQRPQH